MSKKTFTKFENPSYINDDNDIELTETNYDEDGVLAEFESVEEAFNELEEEEEVEELDVHTLNFGKISLNSKDNVWRHGPAPVSENEIVQTKIATLEGDYVADISEISAFLDQSMDENERNVTASAALINYFAHLGTTDNHVKADLTFLEVLLKNADINSCDLHGQTLFHEVAREWNTDLAYYLKLKGANIDVADKWGRTPLIVASASNHHEMVQWLLQNGVNIKQSTVKGEGQSAIHYAAKYDALDAFKVLMDWGADPIGRDDRNRTPFFLAAEHGVTSMCEYMLQLELPTASYSDTGVSVIDHIVNKLPVELGKTALDQFIVKDKQYRRKKSYLSCLGKRRWRLLTNSFQCHSEYSPPTPLEMIVEQNDLELIRHPIILELIQLKRDFFGFKFNCINIFLTLLFTAIWTVAISVQDTHEDLKHGDEDQDQDHNQGDNDPNLTIILVFTAIGQVLSFLFMIKLFFEYRSHSRAINNTKQERFQDMEFERKYCHPRWPVEEKILTENQDVIKRFSSNYWADGWNVIEALCLIMSTIETIITIIRKVKSDTNNIDTIRHYYSAVFVMVLWLRLNRSMRIIGSLGPFIAMLGECVIATARFCFLFFEFFIPFSVAFWVTFGGVRENAEGDEIGGEYVTFNDMLYQLYLLTIVGDYDYDTLQEIDEITSQVLVGLYFILVSVISLNLFIALLSEAVARVNETASATAYIKEAEELINIERLFPEVKRNFDIYVNKYCAPKVTPFFYNPPGEGKNAREIITELSRNVKDTSSNMQQIIQDQLDMKKNLDIGETAMRTFQEKYDDDKMNEVVEQFEDVYSFHVTALNKIHRKTRNRFAKLFSFGGNDVE